MTTQVLLQEPGEQMAYPQNESHCHGAPVYKLLEKTRKYVCMECGKFCIPSRKTALA
jgi:hypothetical protein